MNGSMLELDAVITPERTVIGAPANSKKKVLELISQELHSARPELDADDLFSRLTDRERLGSTGFGNGVAIPHCRLGACQAPTGLLLRLAEPIDFDAMDQKRVDLICALIVPEEANQEHLQILSRIAERFSSDDLLTQMRAADAADQLHSLFTGRPD